MTDSDRLRRKIQSILDGLHAATMLETNDSLERHPELLAEIEEARSLCSDPNAGPEVILSVAVGLVESYVDSCWPSLGGMLRSELEADSD